ncbi:MAG: DUF4062 domain-containing protein [Desulfobacteraceae bacterium]
MINNKLVVFISSTSDLKAEREMVAGDLPASFSPYLYERERAGGKKPRDRINDVLRKSSAFIGILGERYGSDLDSESDRSIVEWEFDSARQYQKKQAIEIMAFQKANMNMDQIDERQRRFLEKIGGFSNEEALWIKFYDSPQHLCAMVKDSLLDWLSDFYLEMKQHGVMGQTGSIFKLLVPTGVLFLALSVLVYVLFK